MNYKRIYRTMADNDYKSVLESYTTGRDDIKRILDRGLLKCFKPTYEGPRFLLTGINPSFSEGDDVWPGEIGKCDISNSNDGYWKKKANQFGDIWSQVLYLDLFPVRERHQIKGFESAFKNENVFRRNLLEVTQAEIESLQPRLIVHANKDSMYYWGVKKNTPIGEDANDEVNPWMGYKVKRVTPEDYPDLPKCMLKDNRLVLFPFYEIVGFINSENRINRFNYKESSLKGSFLLEYVMDGQNKRYSGKLYKQNPIQDIREWEEIWSWVKNHTNSPDK